LIARSIPEARKKEKERRRTLAATTSLKRRRSWDQCPFSFSLLAWPLKCKKPAFGGAKDAALGGLRLNSLKNGLTYIIDPHIDTCILRLLYSFVKRSINSSNGMPVFKFSKNTSENSWTFNLRTFS
jgi:hypothetical protein